MKLKHNLLGVAMLVIMFVTPVRAQVQIGNTVDLEECNKLIRDMVIPGAKVSLCNLAKQVGMFSVFQAKWDWERKTQFPQAIIDEKHWYIDAYKFGNSELAAMTTKIIREGQLRARNKDFDEKAAECTGKYCQVAKIQNGRAIYRQLWDMPTALETHEPKLLGYTCRYLYIADPIYLDFRADEATTRECDGDFAKAIKKANSVPIREIESTGDEE